MTAVELIKILATVPPETEVRVRDWEYMSDAPMDRVLMPGESYLGGNHITVMHA